MRALGCFALAAALLAPLSASAQPCGNGDTITVVPVSPTAGESITLQLRGFSGASQSFLFDTTHDLQGATIRVDTTLDPGVFAVGSSYGDDHELGHLPPGSYTVEEWIQCWQEGPVGAPYLAASTTLTVGTGVVPAIPTLSETGMGALLVSLALAGMFLVRRRA